MIAIDSSSWIAYFSGAPGADTDTVESALSQRLACLPPVVLTELLSDPDLPRAVAELLLQLPLLAPEAGYWERAGRLRARVLSAGRKARLADVLIAQSCLDRAVPLITRDRDFRNFARIARLRLTA